MERLAQALPSRLSGGEGQRLALARALVADPQVLLLDEPLGALDARLRQRMLELIRQVHDQRELTTIFVTHDSREALLHSNRVAVLGNGQVLQTGRPQEVYRFPNTPRVAELCGPVVLVDGELLPGEKVALPFGACDTTLRGETGSKVQVLLRPENVEVHSYPYEPGCLEGAVRGARFCGAYWEVDVECAGITLKGRAAGEPCPGDKVCLELRGKLGGFLLA
jgi:spermidine/putrescine transport system ATP-binding protein